MNNEWICRAKRRDTGKLVYGYYMKLRQTDESYLHIIVDESGEYHSILPETLGRFTGLADRIGTRIFEGDILSAHLDEMFPENETRLVVEWYQFGFFGVNENGFFDDFDNGFEKHFVVIGNIHDNPELTGGDEK